jgi:glycosyltransferase involved in cell wall biosynthesis
MKMGKFSVLHTANILNNSYINCKFLRRSGINASVLNVDYRHVQGQPEWEDVYINEPIEDQFRFDLADINLGDYKRPDWFYDLWINEIEGAFSEDAHSSRKSLSVFGRIFSKLKRRIPPLGATAFFEVLQKEFAAYYSNREKRLSLEDIMHYYDRAQAYLLAFRQFDLIQACGIDSIYVMLSNINKPFISFSHGTIRGFPYDDSPLGRLYALSLHKAQKVIITNADCNISAERLNLNNYTFIPHPVDEELYFPSEDSELRNDLKNKYSCDYILLAPARHHWKKCPPGMETSWFKRNDILIKGLARFFSNNPEVKAHIIFFEWGQEVDESKKLIKECGIEDKVHWEPIQSKPAIRELYNASDVVYDQFNDGIGTFGTVVPESLACGKPVLLNYKKELHHWCYSELPPAINVSDEESIENETKRLLSNDEYRHSIGKSGREWFMRYHSSKIVASKMIDVYREINDKMKCEWDI